MGWRYCVPTRNQRSARGWYCATTSLHDKHSSKQGCPDREG